MNTENLSDNTLILHQKIYDFVNYAYPILNKYPKSERYELEARTKNHCFDMLEESVRFMNGSGVNRLYNIDAEKLILVDLFTMAKDQNIKAVGTKRVGVISGKLNEIGRITGGLIQSAKGHKK